MPDRHNPTQPASQGDPQQNNHPSQQPDYDPGPGYLQHFNRDNPWLEAARAAQARQRPQGYPQPPNYPQQRQPQALQVGPGYTQQSNIPQQPLPQATQTGQGTYGSVPNTGAPTNRPETAEERLARKHAEWRAELQMMTEKNWDKQHKEDEREDREET
ncbi:hypothetical protein QBC37DRAFT_407345 [Rhypophila decipiens]|uniref:Uncharacterized protein n=1 Tax=Rhypophila decipiens TaxID=261697 RepID=A0AAN7B194_9PEZI|nr:hypothetical protein QBC37DRAFT_407345 [Rhypophila decipiens]